MYVNPVLFGVLATLFIEQSITLAVIWLKNNRRTSLHNTKTKGGKYNG